MTVYIATCRDETCLWHRSPARFEDYGDRAHNTGVHRVITGHAVDYSSVEESTEEDAEREAQNLDLETELLEHEYQPVTGPVLANNAPTVCKCGETPEARPPQGDWAWWVSHVVKVMDR